MHFNNKIFEKEKNKKKPTMESIMTKSGRSLKTASVHELAKQKLSSVPPCFVRADEDPKLPLNSSFDEEIPVIDLQKLLSGDDDLINLELEMLHFACKEWGFFQIVNHRVSSPVVEKVKEEIEAFFHLPTEEKEKFGQATDGFEGFGQGFFASDEQKVDWVDMFFLLTQPAYLRKPYLFPKLPLSFREALEVYSGEMKSLAMKIFTLLARALRIELEDMSIFFDDGIQSLRMNHYPPCPQPELVIGSRPHSDSAGLTILLQVGEVEGLQVRKDGAWVSVLPLPNAFIVNVGDILEIMTNGLFKSVEHRAIVNNDKERISIAAFHAPKLEGDVGPIPRFVEKDNNPRLNLNSESEEEDNSKSDTDKVQTLKIKIKPDKDRQTLKLPRDGLLHVAPAERLEGEGDRQPATDFKSGR